MKESSDCNLSMSHILESEYSPGYFGSLGLYSGVMSIYFAFMYGVMLVKMMKPHNQVGPEKTAKAGKQLCCSAHPHLSALSASEHKIERRLAICQLTCEHHVIETYVFLMPRLVVQILPSFMGRA